MKLSRRVLIPVLALTLILPALSCGLLGKCTASLSEMYPGMSEEMDGIECWLTIKFKKYPEGINPLDVKVVFSSIALFEDQTFTWGYIAANDVVPQGMGKGNRPNEETRPDLKPPLNTKIKVKYPLRARPKIDVEVTDTITLYADLYWGGKKLDSASKALEHTYYRTLEKE